MANSVHEDSGNRDIEQGTNGQTKVIDWGTWDASLAWGSISGILGAVEQVLSGVRKFNL